MNTGKPTANEIEAANRAEVTALLIRARYRVYRPEADVMGEDLVLRTPTGELRAVQLKARPEVNWKRYGDRSLLAVISRTSGPGAGGLRRNCVCEIPESRLVERRGEC